MIASTKEIKPNLSDNIRDFKKFTSTKIIASINDETEVESRRSWMLWLFKSAGNKNPNNVNYQFWRQDNHPKEIFTKAFMESKLDRAAHRYIHNNPVATGLVENSECHQPEII